MKRISFCIITDGKGYYKFLEEICDIANLRIPDCEVIVAGQVDPYPLIDLTIPMVEEANQGEISKLRNAVCRKATGDVLVVLDDDFCIKDDFYTGLLKYGDDFDVLSCKLLNVDGTRYWDWKIHQNGIDTLIDYDVKEHPDLSLTGGLTIMKRQVFDVVQWNETLGYGQKEDVDFSNRLKKAGFRMAFNPHSTVVHNDHRYHQVGNEVKMISAKP